jgi:hypothetical protein
MLVSEAERAYFLAHKGYTTHIYLSRPFASVDDVFPPANNPLAVISPLAQEKLRI